MWSDSVGVQYYLFTGGTKTMPARLLLMHYAGICLLFYFTIFRCVHLRVHVHMCLHMCIWVWGQDANIRYLSQLFSILFLLQSLSLSLKLTYSARLAVQWDTKIHLSLPSQSWNYRWVLEVQTQVFKLVWNILHQLHHLSSPYLISIDYIYLSYVSISFPKLSKMLLHIYCFQESSQHQKMPYKHSVRKQ